MEINNFDNNKEIIKTFGFNSKIRPDEWERYERPISQNSIIALYKVCEEGRNIVAGKLESINEQEIIPRSFIEGYINARKDKIFCEKIGMQTLEKNYSLEKTKLSNLKKKGHGNGSKKHGSKEENEYNIKLKISENRFKYDFNSFYANDGKIIPAFVGTGNIDLTIADLISHLNAMIINKKNEEKELYEAFFGISKIIKKLGEIYVHHDVSNNCIQVHNIIIDDLNKKYNEFVSYYKFNYETASKLYPRIFYQTKYDKILPGMSIKPYKSQLKMLNFVNDNLDKSFTCVFNTLMGMGKTTLVTALAEIILIKDSSKTLIYICPEDLKSVREIVGRNLHQSNINFAVAYIDGIEDLNGNYKVIIKEQNACKYSQKKPAIILAGVKAAIELFKRPYKHDKFYEKGKIRNNISYTLYPNKYVMFFDENTISLDMKQSPMVHHLKNIYRFMPPCSIFSSATHPNIEELDNLKKYIEIRYPEIIFKTINYSSVLIGTQLNNMKGQLIIPHSLCKTFNQLKLFIDKIEKNLMFKKFYTLPLVNSMYNKLVKLNIQIPKILIFKNYMDDFGHRNQESVQNLGIEYLKLILSTINNQSDNILLSEFNNIIETNIEIDYNNLIKTSEKITGSTFISCLDPYNEMLKKFSEYFKEVMNKMKIKSFQELFEKYKIIKNDIEKKNKSFQKAKSSLTNEKINKLERAKIEHEETWNIIIPSIPYEFLLGKPDNKIRIPLQITNWDDIIADDIIKFAALFGIFIYSEKSHYTYHDFIIDCIESGKCIYSFSDSSLNFGNSLPFDKGIITKDMALHSSNTLCQLMARAGRPGVSDSAVIYADDSIVNILFDSIYNPNFIDYELININKAIKHAFYEDLSDIIKKKNNQYFNLLQEEKNKKEEILKLKRLENEKIKKERLEEKLKLEHKNILNSRWNKLNSNVNKLNNNKLNNNNKLDNNKWERIKFNTNINI